MKLFKTIINSIYNNKDIFHKISFKNFVQNYDISELTIIKLILISPDKYQYLYLGTSCIHSIYRYTWIAKKYIQFYNQEVLCYYDIDNTTVNLYMYDCVTKKKRVFYYSLETKLLLSGFEKDYLLPDNIQEKMNMYILLCDLGRK